MFSLLVGFVQDWMAVIEIIELLSQLECVLREIRWLSGRDALIDEEGRFRGHEPEFPDLVARIALEKLRKIPGRSASGRVGPELVRIQSALAEDVRGAYDGVLCVRSSLAFK